MSIISILKQYVPRYLRMLDRPFQVPVSKQQALLASLPEPKDNMERSYYQYICQRLFWGIGFHICASIAAAFLLPIQAVSLIPRRNVVLSKTYDLILLSEDMPDNIFPDILLNEYPSQRKSTFLEGYSFSIEDWKYFCSLMKRYPFSPYFLYKCMIKMAIYSHQISTYRPEIITTCGGEFSFTSSFLTDYCEKRSVYHYNTMHGEMFYYVLDSFCNFHKFYVWDIHYKNLLNDLRATAGEFIIANPKSVVIDPDSVNIEGLKNYDFKYYLQLHEEEQLKSIAAASKRLKEFGYSICVRYHPRTPKIDVIYKFFAEDEVENPKLISIERSIKATRNVIGLNSTVLYQAFMSGVNVVIDDITDVYKFQKIKEMRYIMLSKKHQLLSQYIPPGCSTGRNT